jgi:hypothetical protein
MYGRSCHEKRMQRRRVRTWMTNSLYSKF